jgi:hypothetical protein
MTNLLGLYGGCDGEELKRIRKLPSRWVALCTTFPSLVIYEGGCYLLHATSPDAPPSTAAQAPQAVKRPRTGRGAAGGGEEDEYDEYGDGY